MTGYRLILNADDFGLTEGVCAGIVEAIRYGCVTATTAMAAVPGAAERLARWAPLIPGRIGAHLQLTSGTPVLDRREVPTLAGAGGAFPASKKELRGAAAPEIVREWHAQVQLLQSLGIQPTHVDTHHQVHKYPHVLRAFIEIARHYRLPARALDAEMARELRAAGVVCADRTLLAWYGGDLSAARLLQVIQDGAGDVDAASVLEVMCHPGRVDHSLAGLSRYLEDREAELRVLTEPAVRQRLLRAGFRLCGFAEAWSAPSGGARLPLQ